MISQRSPKTETPSVSTLHSDFLCDGYPFHPGNSCDSRLAHLALPRGTNARATADQMVRLGDRYGPRPDHCHCCNTLY